MTLALNIFTVLYRVSQNTPSLLIKFKSLHVNLVD